MRPETTATHDVRLALHQRRGPLTSNMAGMVLSAARGYAWGPCWGRTGRVILLGWPPDRDRTGIETLRSTLAGHLAGLHLVDVEEDHPEGLALLLTVDDN